MTMSRNTFQSHLRLLVLQYSCQQALGRGTIPVFWALIKATLLVSGLRRMKPHSLCIGLCVSGWKELNLEGKTET